LTGAIPAGTTLYFGEAGELARTTAAAAVGATSVATDALPAALESGDSATYVPDLAAPKVIPAGTRMGDAGTDGKIYPRVVTTNPAKFLLATDAVEEVLGFAGHLNRSSYGVIRGGVVYENLLPGATGSPKVIPSAEKTELQTAGVGTGFSFVQYRDSTA
jgi:hypothetical protein